MAEMQPYDARKRVKAKDSSGSPWLGIGFGAAIALPFVFMGLWYIGVAVAAITGLLVARGAWANKTWGEVGVTLPGSAVMMGETFVAEMRTVGGESPDGYAVDATLVCREAATYRSGTDKTTAHSKVHLATCTVADRSHDGGVAADLEVSIPRSGPPSMKLGSNNKIEWYIEVQLRAPGVPDISRRFDVRVRPIVFGASQ